MIYFFTWNSSLLIKQQIKAWKDKFIKTFWEFNLIHIKSLEEHDNNFLSENISSSSFLSEKKLIIIDLDNDISEEKQDFLMKILLLIPDSNIVLLNYINPDKRTKFYKFLIKTVGEIKEFNINDDFSLSKVISDKYNKSISNQAIQTLISYKSKNIEKIFSEIDKLLINYEYIEQAHIIENIYPELEESIFQVIDDILNNNITSTIKKIDIILENTNIYAFYNNLLANLRTSVFILKLKNNKTSTNEIWSLLNLWNRAFLVNKNYKLSFKKAEDLYINLINIDKKMKSWFLLWTTDNEFKYELEKVLIKNLY